MPLETTCSFGRQWQVSLSITSQFWQWLERFVTSEHKKGLALVVDETVWEQYASPLAPFSAFAIPLPSGEEHKHVQTVLHLLEEFQRRRLARQSVVLAIGGGVTSDVVGFAASIYLRGIDWLACPTTLLAMVDAALGGKVGVNFGGKNLLGSFYPPREIRIWPGFLPTLSQECWHSGAGEVLKHAILGGTPQLWQNFPTTPQVLEPERLWQAMAVKLEYWQKDPWEKGPRRLLNLGHTFGHALEALHHYTLPHGVAVAWGIRLAAQYALRMGLTTSAFAQEVSQLVEDFFGPLSLRPGDGESMIFWIRRDKKNRDGKIVLILPRDWGRVEAIPQEEERVLTFLQSLERTEEQ